MANLNKKIQLKNFEDYLNLIHMLLFSLVVVISLVYVVFTVLDKPKSDGAWINDTPSYIFLSIAATAGLSYYLSIRYVNLKSTILTAVFYTVTILLLIITLPSLMNAPLNLNMYGYPTILPDGTLLWLTLASIWTKVLHVVINKK